MSFFHKKRSLPGETKPKSRVWPVLWKTALFLSVLAALVAIGAFAYIAKDLPSPGSVNTRVIPESTKIYDRTGTHLLYEVHGEEKRTVISFSDMPDVIRYATISLEDQDFYNHYGIKLTSIVRSVLKDVVSFGKTQGGSTITQQFVKNSLLTNEKTLIRKVKEVILSLEMETKFSKDEILAMYLNEIPYGSNAYGIEAAAQTFFGKPARELTLDEAALIAVCHTFGVLCRWSGAAEPVLRGPEKGKCSGVLENILARPAAEHPWFRRFADLLGPSARLRVVENRLFDLVPSRDGFPPGAVPIAFETRGVGGEPGDAVTMIEFARDRIGVMPRMFAVNHHPEIVDRFRQMMILDQKRDRGEVSEAWYRERLEILTRQFPEEDVDQRLHLTSDFTLLGPLRFHLFRALRRRAQALSLPLPLHEDRVIQGSLGEPVGAGRAGEVF